MSQSTSRLLGRDLSVAKSAQTVLSGTLTDRPQCLADPGGEAAQQIGRRLDELAPCEAVSRSPVNGQTALPWGHREVGPHRIGLGGHATTGIIDLVDCRSPIQTRGEVGSAGASCTGYVAGIVGIAPGHGVIVAQARSNSHARKRGVQMLLDGKSPQSIVDAVANGEFDDYFQEQQYGVAALGFADAPAVFTGDNTHDWQGHATAQGVAVQGNILTGPEVVEATLAAFEASRSLPLADRLLAALEAGGEAGGDSRCGDQDALSAYLAVAKPDDPPNDPYVKFIVPVQKRGGDNPVRVLRALFQGER